MSDTPQVSLGDACATLLLIPDPIAKARGVARLSRRVRNGRWRPGSASAGDRPARPPQPVLLSPREMPKRKIGSPRGRAALLHALAHIELNAVDLALDIVVRFGGETGPLAAGDRLAFCQDWLGVARDEAKHFLLLSRRMRQLDVAYGDFPAHDGLWTAAEKTSHDLLARLAIVPLVHEARGLDVQPIMIDRLKGAGDAASADVLAIIARDEVNHVRIGYSWFTRLCALNGVEPNDRYRALVAQYHGSAARGEFNTDARMRAGLPQSFYQF